MRENRDNYYIEIAKQQASSELITPGDKLSFILKTRNGFELIDVIDNSSLTGGNTQLNVIYLVREDGNVDLPLLGDLKVSGMTRKQLEDLLEKKYSNLYNDPFVILTITNHRAYVFKGLGTASVVLLPNENTKLIELLALTGGIPPGSKSSKIRIIRGDFRTPQIKKVDMSTIEGLKDADFIIQPNDLVVIDPTTKIVPAILGEITPILALITTGLTLFLIFKR